MAQAPPKTRNLGRLTEIAQVAVRHGFGYFFERHKLTDLLPGRRNGEILEGTPSQRGQHLRELLDELGPTFVKFGQLLSMRPDVLPPDIIAELRALQDDVRPFPYEDVERVIQEDLGQPIERLFVEFDREPLAAASIGQVHRAVLPNGHTVAVKVQRPGAPERIEADLGLLYQAARIVKERVRALDFVDVREVVDEFARAIRQELDYRLEGRNAEQLHRNFAGHPHVRVPRVYWSYTRARVLTLEFIDGTQLADIDQVGYSLEERKRLAEVIAEAWMTMIFRDGFFHGDPHPANILVIRPDVIGLVDFGLAGKLTEDDISKATRLFIDVANENVQDLPKRLADLGVRYPKEREEEFRTEISDFYYRYYGARLSEIDPQQVIREVFGLIYSLNLRLPTRFIILDKAIATLGSVGIELYPDFNVFEVAKPYARSLLMSRYTPQRMASRARRETLKLASIFAEYPYQVHDVLEEMRDGQFEIGFVHKGLDEFMQKLDVAFNRLIIAFVVGAGLIGSSLIGVFATSGPQVLGLNIVSAFGFFLSGVLGLWLLWGVFRSGRI
jgi:ubiquinone biosynthesis protein